MNNINIHDQKWLGISEKMTPIGASKSQLNPTKHITFDRSKTDPVYGDPGAIIFISLYFHNLISNSMLDPTTSHQN